MKRTVLIVDDIRTNRIILKNLLSDEYSVYEAADGMEALSCMVKAYSELSAILLDLSMPIMDGFDVLRHMQDDPLLRHIPVIVTTGQTEDASEVKALQMGASDYISKPYKPAIIKQRVKNAIELRETAAAVNELQRDRLTGLFSRNTFFEKAGVMISGKEPGYYVISCFDIDNFKVVNDQYGTEKGDMVLCLIAGMFKQVFEAAGGICFRMMADTFSVLYPRSFMESDEIDELLKKVRTLDGSIQPLSFSIGRYIIDDLSLSVNAMYDRASMAENSIKGRYDQTIAVYDKSMRDRLLAQQQIVTEMKGALEDGQFEPWFQPQYNHATGRLIGAEALVRWRHPQKGMISPGTFIPLFEKNGFIYELDKYIWEQTCLCLRKWIDEGRNPLPVSVNISRYDVFRDDLIDVLAGLLKKYALPVDLLRLEITESAFSTNTDQIVSVVKQFISDGFTVEIDDFGSGYSSLITLKDVPAQIIKLDMQFLKSSDESQRGGNILESVVRMAKWLDMSVIAEGVETLQQADYLKSIGCFLVQGFLYAKPLPLKEYEALAAESEKQRETPTLKTVRNLDNNSFWNPESIDTLIFNSYLGGACILEYENNRVELIRANDRYIQVIGGTGLTIEKAMRLNWTEYMDDKSRQTMWDALKTAIDKNEEQVVEFVFLNLPGCAEKTYLRSTLRVIARTGPRLLIYCTNENITAQRLAEQKRQETTEQLSFLERLAHELLTIPDANAGLNALIKKMLDYFDGNRCYIFEFDFIKKVTSNTYEFCADGVTEEKSLLQDVPLDTIPFWLHAFDNQNYIEIADVDALESDRPEKELLQVQNIRSLIAVPLRKNGKLTGFIGIDDPRRKHKQIESLSALGDYAAVLLTRRDMEERIKNENQEKLAVMNGIPGGFVRMQVKPDGSVIPLYCSSGYQKLVNKSSAELLMLCGNNALANVYPDDMAIVKDAVESLIRFGEARNIRFRLQKGGGGFIWVSIFGKMRKSRDGKIFLNIYYADATDDIKRENAQIELLDNLPCGAALYEVHGNSLSAIHLNRHYWELVGRPPVKYEDIDVLEAIYPDDRHIIPDEIAAAISQKRDAAGDIRILCGDGGYRMFHITGRFIQKSDGRTTLYVTYTPVSIDLTQTRELLPVILSAIMESTSDYSFVKDDRLRYICASNAFAGMTGAGSAQELIGKTDYELFERDIADKYRRDDEELMSSGRSIVDMIEAIPSVDGAPRYSKTSKYLLRSSAGDIVGLYGTGRDVTDERDMTEKLRISKEEYELAMQHTGSCVCRFTIEDRTLAMPADVAKARGLPDRIGDMPNGMIKLGVIPEESERLYTGFYDRIMNGEKSGSMIFHCRMENGMRWLEEHFSTVFSGDGKPLFAVISYSDITDRQEKELIYKKWQQSLQGKRKGEYTLFRCNISKNDPVDTQEGSLLHIDFDLSSRSFDERSRDYAARFVFEDDRVEYTALLNTDAMLAGYYRGVRYRTLEYREIKPDGGVRWLRLTLELVEYPNSSDVEAYLMYENIDDEKKAELRIKAHAENDPLTGILNRAAFAERTNRMILERKHDALAALLMLDLDDFKQLNDKYGHIVGDKALIEVGRRLKTMLRSGDLVGRLGGDEFLVCQCDMPDREVIERRVGLLKTQLQAVLDNGVKLGLSIGIAVCPDDGCDFNELYQKADIALYHAKRAGKNQHSFYREDMGGLNSK